MTTLLSLLSFSLFIILCSSQVNEFAFTGFNHPETNLTFNGAARYQNGVLQLTDQTSNINGHAFYPSPIQFKSSSTANVSSFSTCFVFSIHPEYPDLGFGGGHGFAFAIATNKQLIYSSLPSRSQYLGLLNDNDVGNQIFAVEFDTVKDSELDDMNDNHVGINVNSLVSNAAAAAAYYTNDSVKHDLDLRSGNRVVAWIDYDSITNLVNVTLSSTSAKPITPLLSLAVDLTPILRQKMYVGFSASTGWLTSSSHYISGWSFKMMGESKPLDLGSLPLAPAAGNEIKYNMKLYNRLTHRYSLLENRQFPTAKTPMGIPSWNYWQISIALAVSLSLAVCFVYSKTREKRRRSLRATTVAMREFSSSTVESLQYDIAQIRAATADFSDANKLGRGGFGFVYKGIFENGQEIAVKRLSGDSNQGNAEFNNEVLLVAELQHRNLVKLLGFALEGSEKLLVYEYVENASLDRFIFDPIKRSTLDWDTRTKIIKGVVRGLVYLHVDSRLRIIHRDLKPSNILLDGDMNPKIADFGIAKLSKHDEVQGHTQRIVGTFGYMAPEYAMHGEFSMKSDVYSFGVLILEIISGRKNIQSVHQEYLLTDIWKNWQKGTPAHMVDPHLLQQNSTSSLSEMVKYIHIGLLCIQEDAGDRPTMTEVLRMLDAPNSTLPQPSNLAFYSSSGVDTMADQGQVAALPITPVVKGPDPNPKRSCTL